MLPEIPQLRKGVIHNDANDYNVLVSEDPENPEVISVIDFGDAVYTPIVNDLAIAIAYAAMHKPDPLSAAAHVVRGFHQEYPLKDEELRVLFPLICTRLLISVTVSAINKVANPENEYLLISERPAWELLGKLRLIDPAFAHYTFRHACGYEPCPQASIFKAWVGSSSNTFSPVVPVDFKKTPYRKLDLGVGSLDLGNNQEYDNDQSVFTYYPADAGRT